MLTSESLDRKAAMIRLPRFAVLFAAVVFSWMHGPAVFGKGKIDFARDVSPIFEQHCVRCHQPTNKKGELSLATAEDSLAQGFVTPGDPTGSYLLEVITSADGKKPSMPKEGASLSEKEVETLRSWIAEGAVWPTESVVREKPKADRGWWSLRPLSVQVPAADGIPGEWLANPIDRFIYHKLQATGLAPNPPADRRTLIRRLTYDLTGLPPTTEEVAAFEADESPDAYERLVDRLLASPRYGEHWGRHWLDVVRFGESTGFEVNVLTHHAWPFRDYVIRSLNEDKPFNQFVIEHLAGDAVGQGDASVEVGLTFLVCGPYDLVENNDAVRAAQIRADTVDEIIRATGEAFLGLTVGCARCHDHKFDPITQRDYYSIYATFAGVYHDDRVVAPQAQQQERAEQLAKLEALKKPLVDEKAALETKPDGVARVEVLNRQIAEIDQKIADLPQFPVMRVGRYQEPPGPQTVFERGDASRKGEQVLPASMSTLADAMKSYALPADVPERERRQAFARWLVADENPLTPRVLANRLWQHHFGTGVVATPSDFGYMGERPSHPELLDWLAAQLHEHGWRLKPVHKLIVMSQAYRQSSTYRDDCAQVDADSRLLWRFPPRRLAAEELRDTILMLAGKLDERRGGPGFQLYGYSHEVVATYTPLEDFGPETFRRSVYHQNARSSRIDLLSDFDAPDCAFSVGRRIPTTTPAQALSLLNHKFTLAMAEALASRAVAEAGSDLNAQMQRIFAMAFNREAGEAELAASRKLVEQHSLRALCRAVLNSSEMMYVD